MWALYMLTNTVLLSRLLTWMHIMLSIVFVAVIAIIPWWRNRLFSAAPKRYFDKSNVELLGSFENANRIIMAAVLILLIVQLLSAINVFGGLIKKWV